MHVPIFRGSTPDECHRAASYVALNHHALSLLHSFAVKHSDFTYILLLLRLALPPFFSLLLKIAFPPRFYCGEKVLILLFPFMFSRQIEL